MNIKNLRKCTGLTQTQFGNQYNIPLRTIQHWENGTRKPADYIVHLLERVVKEDYGIRGIDVCGNIEDSNDSNIQITIGDQVFEYDISGWRYFSVEDNVEGVMSELLENIELADGEEILLRAKLKDFYTR